MSIRVEGLDSTEIALQRIGPRVHKRSLDVVRRYSKKMAEMAQELAPIKEGYLESAIEVLGEERGDRNRTEIIIGVDANKLGPGYKKYGERYDWKMEEGEFNNLGSASQRKASRTGRPVGAHFLERGVLYYEKELMEELNLLAGKVKLR